MRLHFFGVNHRTTPVEIRERFAFDPETIPSAGEELARFGADERVILSTCNRAEVYAMMPGEDEEGERLLGEFFAEFHGVDRGIVLRHSYHAMGDAVTRHLLRVASSLDSMVLGESEVLRQVREAHEIARDRGWTGASFNRLFGCAVETGKRVRTETAIGQSTTSVSSAAVDLARKLFGSLERRTVLVVGAGEMAKQVAGYLIGADAAGVIVANRSRSRAEALLESLPRLLGSVIDLDGVGTALGGADLVVTSTGAKEPILTVEMVRKAMKQRRNRPLFVVDIAVPRDVEPAVGDLYNVFLYHIDHLREVVRDGEICRQAAAALAEEIVEGEVKEFHRWLDERRVVPAIALLRQRGHAVADAEVERVLRRIGGLSPEDEEAVRHLGNAIVSKLLHDPTVRLKEAAAGERGARRYVEALKYLFALRPESGLNGRSAQPRTLPEGSSKASGIERV